MAQMRGWKERASKRQDRRGRDGGGREGVGGYAGRLSGDPAKGRKDDNQEHIQNDEFQVRRDQAGLRRHQPQIGGLQW